MATSEQDLNESLIDPENLDAPPGQVWTKGEEQPAKCRDSWAAILFYGQFVGIAVVAGMLGVPAVQKNYQTGDTGGGYESVDYSGLLYGELMHDPYYMMVLHAWASYFSFLPHSFAKIIVHILPFSLPNRWWMLLHPIRPLPLHNVKLPYIPSPALPPILNNHVPRRRNHLLPISECRGRYIRHNLLPNFVLLRVCGMEENSIRGCQFEHGVDGC